MTGDSPAHPTRRTAPEADAASTPRAPGRVRRLEAGPGRGPLRDAGARVHGALTRFWDARTVPFRRVVRTSALLLVTGTLSLLLGVVTASGSSPVGPHEADWSTTLDSSVSLDLGPVGSVSLDSPVAPLGVDVVLGEIPAAGDDSAVSSTSAGLVLSSDGAAYVNLISHPEPTIEAGVRALAADALRRAGLLESIVLSLAAAGRLAARGRLRDGVRAGLSRGPASVLIASTTAVAVAALLVPRLTAGTPQGSTLDVLSGTALADARVSGRVADVIEAYGPRVKTFLDEDERFYTAAEANLRAAWAASQAVGGTTTVTASDGEVDDDAVASAAATALARERLTGQVASPAPTASEPATASLDPGASPGDDATASASSTPRTTGALTTGQDGAITAVMSTDLHCNLDMIALAGTLDEVSGAAVHMDDGDLTMTGSSAEQVCVDALDRAVPRGTARVATIGNHDSADTAARLRAMGWTVTDGTVQKVAGLTVLGDVDAERTDASGTRQRGDETVEQLGTRLSTVACDSLAAGLRVDVMLIHEPYTFAPMQASGCTPLLLAGHVHQERGMSVTQGQDGPVAALISGAGKGGTSLGAVTQDAYLHVLSFSTDGDLLAWRAVVVHTDASVTVGAWQPVPAAGTTGQGAAATATASSTAAAD